MGICVLKGIFEGCEGIAGSREHIIPNAIGGRLSSDKLICKNCNSKSGSKWDAILCNQFTSLCVLFGIIRERGNVPNVSIKNNNEQNVFYVGGECKSKIPKFFEEKIGENKVKFTVESKSKKEGNKVIRSRLNKCGYEVDLSNMEYRETVEVGEELDSELNFDLAGPEVGRSIAKMMYLFTLKAGVEKEKVQNIYDYLSVPNTPQCFGLYYDEDIIINRSESIPMHVVSLCAKNNKLIGYIELFGLFKYIFNISDDYKENDFCESYFLDPVLGQELYLMTDYSKIYREVTDYLTPEPSTYEKMNCLIKEKMPVFMSTWFDKNQEHTLKSIRDELMNELSLMRHLTTKELEALIKAKIDKKFKSI